jgi:hypothetical protein
MVHLFLFREEGKIAAGSQGDKFLLAEIGLGCGFLFEAGQRQVIGHGLRRGGRRQQGRGQTDVPFA